MTSLHNTSASPFGTSPRIRKCRTPRRSSTTVSGWRRWASTRSGSGTTSCSASSRSFPIVDSLTLLTAIAARTKKIKLATGILVLPLRNPVVLAKQLSSMDQLSEGRLLHGVASGWYKREFDAVGVPFEQRGKIMDENLDILKRFWTEDVVKGEWGLI